IVKDNAIVNRLNKTKTEAYPDLLKMRTERDARETAKKKKAAKIKSEEDKALGLAKEKTKRDKTFDTLFDESKMVIAVTVVQTECFAVSDRLKSGLSIESQNYISVVIDNFILAKLSKSSVLLFESFGYPADT
ncbi:hypothetical protein SARC_16115, partial [Sphaeroforma arctica JP610]